MHRQMRLVHYGSKAYDPTRHKLATNSGRNKPFGGLWASPVNSKWGWREWCKHEGYAEYKEDECFRFRLQGNVFVVDSRKDLADLPWLDNGYGIDFEQMIRSSIDAMYLTCRGEVRTRFGKPDLYGWDCESVVILNPRCVILQEDL